MSHRTTSISGFLPPVLSLFLGTLLRGASAQTLINFDNLPLGPVGTELISSGLIFDSPFTVKPGNDNNQPPTGDVILPSPSVANFLDLPYPAPNTAVSFVLPSDPSVPAVTDYVQIANVGLDDTNYGTNGYFNGLEVEALSVDGAVIDSTMVPPVGPDASRPVSTFELQGAGINELLFNIIPNPFAPTALAPTDDWTIGTLTAVPEPATGSLLLICGAGILMRRRLKQLA